MRLSPAYVEAIKTAAREAFGDSAIVRLFGSRIDDDARGGDIDLIIEAEPTDESGSKRTGRFRNELFRHIDEQKVDVVLVEKGRTISDFARLVARDAVPLP